MKTHTTPQRSASRLASISLFTAVLFVGGVINAQQPPTETPAPTTPAAGEPAAPDPAPGPRRNGRIPVPEKVDQRATTTATPADPPKARVVDSATDSRTKSIISHEKDANGVTRTIVRTILDEEVSSNPQEAARNYEAVIAAFDSQRENAAQAIFRLGETYRRLNRLDEARVQYARILREFIDFPDLAKLSQKQLTQTPPMASGSGTMPAGEGSSIAGLIARAAATSEEDRKLLLEEIALLQRQFAETQELIKSGAAPSSSVIPIQREILQLKRQLLHLESRTDYAPMTRNPAAPGSSDPPPAMPATPTPQRR